MCNSLSLNWLALEVSLLKTLASKHCHQSAVDGALKQRTSVYLFMNSLTFLHCNVVIIIYFSPPSYSFHCIYRYRRKRRLAIAAGDEDPIVLREEQEREEELGSTMDNRNGH